MKKITVLLIFLGLFFASSCLAQKVYYTDSTIGYKLLVPYSWTYKKSDDSTFLYGKNIVLFAIQRASISAAEKKTWKKNHLAMANDFAFDYATGFSSGKTKIHPVLVKNYKASPYKAARAYYEGSSGSKKLKINQILTVKQNYVFILTGFAYSKKYSKSNKKYFLPAFKSFKFL